MISRSLVAVSLLLLVLALGGGLLYRARSIYDYQDTVDGVHLPQVDALVCLAGGRGRISAAADLWYRYRERRQGKQPVLYLSGLGHKSTWSSLSQSVR